jgi:hypothetical protein
MPGSDAREIIGGVPPMEPMSPELVLISPPDVAWLARESLPEPGVFGRTGPAVPSPEPRFRHALVMAGVYAGCLLLTVPPILFVALVSPSIS